MDQPCRRWTSARHNRYQSSPKYLHQSLSKHLCLEPFFWPQYTFRQKHKHNEERILMPSFALLVENSLFSSPLGWPPICFLFERLRPYGRYVQPSKSFGLWNSCSLNFNNENTFFFLFYFLFVLDTYKWDIIFPYILFLATSMNLILTWSYLW